MIFHLSPRAYVCITNTANNEIIDIPDGKWCLPRVKTNACNQFSGDSILVKEGESYAWKCNCKYPDLFNNKGEFGDCINEIACGAEYGHGNLVCSDDIEVCKDRKGDERKWVENPDWDPKYGICECNNSLSFVDESDYSKDIYMKKCLHDNCYPGTKDPKSNNCECPDGYISCPSDIPSNNKNRCMVSQCIKDPCLPYGTYQNNDGNITCKCNDGYTLKETDQSIIGHICYKPCDEYNNPCGDRGTCYVNENNVAKCKNCVRKKGWGQDNNNLCKQHLKYIGEDCKHDSECITNDCYKFLGFGQGKCSKK